MSIIDRIRKKQLQELQRSAAGREHFEQRVSQRSETVKNILSNNTSSNSAPIELVILRNLYLKMLESYVQEKSFGSAAMTARSIALWQRVEEARKRSGLSAERFMRAQFSWFHKTFGKAPEPVQLTTDAAVERALYFTDSSIRTIVSNSTKHKVSIAETFKQNEKLLQQMMRAQGCTREEFYKKFVLTNIYSFADEFLKSDPVYCKLLEM